MNLGQSLSRRRGGGGGGGTTFETVTGGNRPSPASPGEATALGWRLVPFTTKAGLDAAISGMAAHDYIYYAGTGVLTISSGTANGYRISGKKPSGPVVLDFGVRASIWAPSFQTTSYVEFKYTGTSNLHGLFIDNCSNLRIWGGSYTSSGGTGIYAVTSSLDTCYVWDFYCHDTHMHGIFVSPSSSTASVVNCNWRGEATRWGGNISNPSWDPHAEKGTGLHGALLTDVGNAGAFQGNTFAIYAHDCPCGSGLEFGQAGGGPISANTLSCKAVNLTHVSTSQTAANTFNLWGSVPLGSNTILWAEGINIQGRVIDWDSGYATSNITGLTVVHGRHLTTNQNPHLSSIEPSQAASQPYWQGVGIVYQDAT